MTGGDLDCLGENRPHPHRVLARQERSLSLRKTAPTVTYIHAPCKGIMGV